MEIENQLKSSTYYFKGKVVSDLPIVISNSLGTQIQIELIGVNKNTQKSIINRIIQGCSKRDLYEMVDHELTIQHIEEIVKTLQHHHIIGEKIEPVGISGIEALLEIEDLTNKLLYEKLYQNIFWKKCINAKVPEDIPLNVIYGMVIENYHFLFRESYFDAPVLSYVPNTNVRLAINNFFAEEYGHDELLLNGLNEIGISRENLAKAIPLPETMALCNSLAYWAHTDPIFFFTTLGVLEGKDIKQDSFLDAAIRIGVKSSFITPVKTHSDININGQHGSLTRKIFSQIPVVDIETFKRMKAQTYLFVELYDALYTAIWNHYSSTQSLLRSVDDI